MDGLTDDVIDATGEEVERLLQGTLFREGDDRRPGTVADGGGESLAAVEIAEHEALDRIQIIVGSGTQPFAEFLAAEPLGREAFAPEGCGVAFRHDRAIVNHDIHWQAPSF